MKNLNSFFQFNNLKVFFRKVYKNTNKSLKYKLLFSFLFVILLPTLLYSIYSYYSLSSTYKESSIRNTVSFVEETANGINYQFDYIRNTSLSLLVNSQVIDFIDTKPENNIEKIISQSQFEHEVRPFLLFNPAWENGILKSIFLFKDINNYHYVTKDTSSVQAIDENLELMRNINSDTKFPTIISSTTKPNTLYQLRECYDLSTALCKGYLFLEIDSTLIFDFDKLIDIYPNLNFITRDKTNNKIIASSYNNLVGTTLNYTYTLKADSNFSEVKINNENLLLVNNNISNTNLELITIIPSKDIFKVSGNPMVKYVVMFFILTILCIKFYSLMYHSILKPLNNLLLNIKKVKNGDLESKMPTYQYDELNDISYVFNNMTDEIDNLINQVYDKQLLIKESELKFLKSQMDPHFIFNVLDTINWHAKLSDNLTISDLTNNLSKLLRANLSFSGNELITVKEELEYINFYIALQKSRFENRLKVIISIADEELLHYKVPKLCIQPLVENAIVHGLEPKIDGGTLKLQLWEDENELFFSIVDDGVGFNTDTILNLESNPISSRKKGHKSIALHNIQRRLELLYGKNYSLAVSSVIGKGSNIRLSLPLDKGDKNV